MHKIKTSILSRGHVQKPIKSLLCITKPRTILRHIFKLPAPTTGSHPFTELWGLQGTSLWGVNLLIQNMHVHSSSSTAYITNDSLSFISSVMKSFANYVRIQSHYTVKFMSWRELNFSCITFNLY